MHWLLQENICREAKWDELVESIKSVEAATYSIHKVVPFSGELIPPDSYNAFTGSVFAYGSTSMRRTCKRHGWKPGVILVGDSLPFLTKMWGPKDMLNPRFDVFTMSELASCRADLTRDRSYFIRPTDDTKYIKGQVLTGQEIYDWAFEARENLKTSDHDDFDASQCMMVTPNVFQPEWIPFEHRIWIVNKKPVAWSQYRPSHSSDVPRRIIDFAAKVADFYSPARAYCLDIAVHISTELKIVEANSINSSGLYDVNTLDLVKALETEFQYG
jgi:hypothetical protein